MTNRNEETAVQLSIDQIVVAVNSEDPEQQFLGMQEARKMVSGGDIPIDLMIGRGIVPTFIQFLQHNDKLQFEAAWALTNITSGTTEQTHYVIQMNAVPHFITLLQSPYMDLVEQAVWALSNIAGDGAAARDIVIQHNVIDGILPLISNETPLSLLRKIVWLMSNLCRNNIPSPPFGQVRRLLPVFSQMLLSQDIPILIDACSSLVNVADAENNGIQAVIDAEAVPRLVHLLQSSDFRIIALALHIIGNIAFGTDQQTDSLISAGGLTKLGLLLQHSNGHIVQETAWIISNITAGSQTQIQAVIDAGIFQQIRHLLEKGNVKAQKNAAWTVTNTILSGTSEQVLNLIENQKIIKPYIDLLEINTYPAIINVVLLGLEKLFRFSEQICGTENLCLMVEDLSGLDKLKALLFHEKEYIKRIAYIIIYIYFKTT
ncbi:importin subunit alpha isoform X2 [Drosophila grimshawi]|uniref:importin subunit alpha isoform X2 n=1 Tax=Drosophila grimshawi TaxID=7222 RepID=UPI000C871650|nr:importin subunit alpha isoform X2 [Drosophila grimshawi]